jgi:hypothetical protein
VLPIAGADHAFRERLGELAMRVDEALSWFQSVWAGAL